MIDSRNPMEYEGPALMIEYHVLQNLMLLSRNGRAEALEQVWAYMNGQEMHEPRNKVVRMIANDLIRDHRRHMANYQQLCRRNRQNARARWGRQNKEPSDAPEAETDDPDGHNADAGACGGMRSHATGCEIEPYPEPEPELKPELHPDPSPERVGRDRTGLCPGRSRCGRE